MYLGPTWVLMFAITCLLKRKNSAHTQLDKIGEKAGRTSNVVCQTSSIPKFTMLCL